MRIWRNIDAVVNAGNKLVLHVRSVCTQLRVLSAGDGSILPPFTSIVPRPGGPTVPSCGWRWVFRSKFWSLFWLRGLGLLLTVVVVVKHNPFPICLFYKYGQNLYSLFQHTLGLLFKGLLYDAAISSPPPLPPSSSHPDHHWTTVSEHHWGAVASVCWDAAAPLICSALLCSALFCFALLCCSGAAS